MTTPIPHPMTLADQVAADLMDKIASGHLSPGERLPGERQIADTLNVSRVSVRAALQQLKARGMLQSVQGGGTRVVSSAEQLIDPLLLLVRSRDENLRDLAEIRVALEGWAARRAAERRTPDQLKALQDAVDAMADAGTGEAARETMATADVNFHLAIGQAADSPVYLHLLSTIRDVLFNMLTYHRKELFTGDEGDAAVLMQHRRILSAVRDQDPGAAETAMTDHLMWVLAHYEASEDVENRGARVVNG